MTRDGTMTDNGVIFLDFDGVLTTEQSDYMFVPELLSHLKDILSATGASIVITSSRRGSTLEDTIGSITDPNNPHVRDVPFPFTDSVVGITPHTLSWLRGQQVEDYLNEHPEVKSYVILDDEDKFFPEQKEHLVLTDGNGLTEENVIRAIEILTKFQEF